MTEEKQVNPEERAKRSKFAWYPGDVEIVERGIPVSVPPGEDATTIAAKRARPDNG